MFTFLLILVIYFSGVAVQYVRINTVYKEWKEERIYKAKVNYDILISIHLAVWGSWLALILMSIKGFLDTKFINKD